MIDNDNDVWHFLLRFFLVILMFPYIFKRASIAWTFI